VLLRSTLSLYAPERLSAHVVYMIVIANAVLLKLGWLRALEQRA
jgi:hypothetical protein